SEDDLEISPSLVEKGKALFATAGCASCHQLQTAGKPLVPAPSHGPDLAKLKPEGGCLAPTATKGLPWYPLSAGQRSALAATIRTAPPVSKEPPGVVARAMTLFNCYACHVRDKVGGPTEETNRFFVTTQPEMGDEGRVPPPLDGAGAKLNPDYLKQILD